MTPLPEFIQKTWGGRKTLATAQPVCAAKHPRIDGECNGFVDASGLVAEG